MRSLFLIYAIFTCHLASSQGNFPFPLSNAQWAEHWDQYNDIPPWNWTGTGYLAHYMTDADTVINGLTYSKVFNGSGVYEASLRDAAGRVMIVPIDYDTEFLLYDFTLPAGTDTFIEVWSHGSFMSEHSMHCLGPVGPEGRIVVDSGTGQWIEGIGSTYGLFEQPGPNLSGTAYYLDCMSHNGMILYPEAGPGICDLTTTIAEMNTAPMQLFPNPATDLLHVRNALDHGLYSIITIDGRIVQQGELDRGSHNILISVLPAGIYVVVIEASGEQLRASFIKE